MRLPTRWGYLCATFRPLALYLSPTGEPTGATWHLGRGLTREQRQLVRVRRILWGHGYEPDATDPADSLAYLACIRPVIDRRDPNRCIEENLVRLAMYSPQTLVGLPTIEDWRRGGEKRQAAVLLQVPDEIAKSLAGHRDRRCTLALVVVPAAIKAAANDLLGRW